MKQLCKYFLVVLVLVSSVAIADEQPKSPKVKGTIISGKISDIKSNELLAGVKISCTNCEKVFYSDLDGKFFIYLETEFAQDLKLEFSQIGYSSKSLSLQEIQATSDYLYINLKSE